MKSNQILLGPCILIAIAGAVVADHTVHTLHRNAILPFELPPEMRAAQTVHAKVSPAVDKLPIGSFAPDFTLPAFEGDRRVHLGSFRGQRPVVLVFGSFTCDFCVNQAKDLERLHLQFKHQAEFWFVHIKEAHCRLPEGLASEGDPSKLAPENKKSWVRKVMKVLGMTMPGLIDDGTAAKDYEAFPLRLVIVDTQGKIAVDTGVGLPDGLELAEAEAWLRKLECGRLRRRLDCRLEIQDAFLQLACDVICMRLLHACGGCS